jgi:DNA polymerase-3 subunit gamma/tau
MTENQEAVQSTGLANGVPADGQSVKLEPPSSPFVEPASLPATRELSEASLAGIWHEVLAQLGPMLAGNLGKAESVAISGPKNLVIRFPSRYNHEQGYCQLSNSITRIQEAIRKLTGQPWIVRVESAGGEPAAAPMKAAESEGAPSSYRRQRADASQEPLVKRALDVLAAQIVHVDDGFGAARLETLERAESANSEES